MNNFKMVGGVKVLSGTKTFDLLESKNPENAKLAKRLMEFTRKAEACGYEVVACRKLRKEFNDVV